MTRNTKYIQSFARNLVSVDSSANIKQVYSKMLTLEISLLPIIDNSGKRNVGVYRRKKLFEWFIKNPKVEIDSIPIAHFKEAKLPEVGMDTSLDDTMQLLHNSSAILVKESGIYKKIISPKVVANALREFSSGFMVYENLENAIRKKIDNSGIVLSDLSDPSLDKAFPTDTKELEFGQYITVFSKKWSDLGLDHLDRQTVLDLLNNARIYRNALMHFKLKDDLQGLDDAKRLLRILQ